MNEAEPVLCGHPCPIICPQFEPCPLEQGHDDEHLYWSQSAAPGTSSRRRNGVWVVDGEGKAVLHADFMGPITPLEIGALLELRAWVKANPSGPKLPEAPVPPGPGFIPPSKGEP